MNHSLWKALTYHHEKDMEEERYGESNPKAPHGTQRNGLTIQWRDSAWALMSLGRSLMWIRNWDTTVELEEMAAHDSYKEIHGRNGRRGSVRGAGGSFRYAFLHLEVVGRGLFVPSIHRVLTIYHDARQFHGAYNQVLPVAFPSTPVLEWRHICALPSIRQRRPGPRPFEMQL
ncbi:uncharacterized protein EV420DRAFT_1477003 [Desarmillaria tabescens]|uniref:Uncharacterized protein n=1 Tax=Armillaria tabescens TaxID=1929756 RepID=A0AA39TPU2_ARMTA|nr:uncharacterized protein EV420DRAFT_1477003 [Desarmillaria tabescens]KAK0462253.1 hypothetical protein EV420DRAFT_1477003 [Desarmillaria tabescens]